MRSAAASSPDPRDKIGKRKRRNRDKHSCFLTDSSMLVVSGKKNEFASDDYLDMIPSSDSAADLTVGE